MALSIRFVAVLAAILAAQTTQGLNFPHGKTLVYKYYGDVKAGTIEPAFYASQFTLEGTLHVKHETSDPALTNTYYVALSDVKTGMYNGAAAYHHRIDTLNPIENVAGVLRRPFLIIYNRNGLLQGIKIPKDEAGWSKNMKMAIASMLQLDLSKIDVRTPNRHQNFISRENTIHGDCTVTNDVYAKGQQPTKNFVIVKFSSPINCTGFEVHSFNHVDTDDCQTKEKDQFNTDSKRVIEIENQAEEIIIKKLYARGGVNYLSSNRKTKAHFILTNSTFDLERIAPVSDINLPFVDFKDVPIIRDVTYQKSEGRYAPNAAVDLTHGRHVVNHDTIVPEVKKMLEEAVDYMSENHLKMEKPDWKHGQTINRILRAISYMDIGSLELVFNAYQNSKLPKDIMIMNFFFDIIPQVGTPATSLFTLRIIRKNKVPKETAMDMLKNLPLNVRTPTEKLLVQMEDLLNFDESVDVNVRKASILGFSSLVYRTFKDQTNVEENPLLQRYLHDFLNRVKNETNYETKIVYLMAIRNVQVGKIYDLLAPIIKGDITILPHPVNIRLLAIWAIEKAIKNDLVVGNKLLWPIMEDRNLPVKLRIAAYKILIYIPNEILLSRISWFMLTESNENLYNYHYTTINNIATSQDPCKRNLREHMARIMRYNHKHKNTRYTLSAAYSYDEYNEGFDIIEKIHSALVLKDNLKVPEVVEVGYSLASGPEAVIDMEIRLHIQGLEMSNMDMSMVESLTDPKVLDVLTRAAKDLPSSSEIIVDIILLRNGRVVLANHYDRETLYKMYDDVMPYIIGPPKTDLNVIYQSVKFDHLSEKQVINDMGLPVVLESRVPIVASLKFNYNTKGDMSIDLGLDMKIWRHGEYALSTYNPIADAWHAMRRSSAVDVNLPIRMTLAFSMSPLNLQITFSPSDLPISGIFVYVNDFVALKAENGVEALKKSCSTCNLHEDVSAVDVEKAKHNVSYDSNLTGLRYSLSLLNCEYETEPDISTLFGAGAPTRREPWKQLVDRKTMTNRQKVKSMVLYPQFGNCGILLKFEPSLVHSSKININLSLKADVIDRPSTSFYTLKRNVYELIATANVISTETNSSITSWELKIKADAGDGHLLNIMKIEMAQKVPGEKTAKICINAQKSYPPVPFDPLKVRPSIEKTNSIVTVTGGYTSDDTCPRDDIILTITMKGQLSNEQMKKLFQNLASGPCSEDKENPLYANTKTLVPMTLNCLNEAITYTTLRKYTINLSEKMFLPVIPFTKLDDESRSIFLPYIELDAERIDSETVKITAEFPMKPGVTEGDDHIETEAWMSTSDMSELNDAFDEVSEPLWFYPLDNTRFSFKFLNMYTDNTMKICVIYPRVTLTADYKSITFNLPNVWTLVTGDHVGKQFAIFAKTVGNNLAVRLYAYRHVVELTPGVDNSIEVMIDGQVVDDDFTEGIHVPPIDFLLPFFTLTRKNEFIIVEFDRVPAVSLIYSPGHATLTIPDFLMKGKVSGLCGHLDDTYSKNITEFYTLT